MSTNAGARISPRPFLKWVGGKRQLLGELRARVGQASFTGRYHEPFVGGGALFFDLYCTGLPGRKKAYLSDSNKRLIEAYEGVQRDVEGLIRRLNKHKAAHGKDYYYEVRGEVPDNPIARAARLIYLNKTCFNGLFRENSKGGFNVPMGNYKNPMICDAPNLRAVAEALCRVKVEQRPFASVLDEARPGDFVYFDPPYDPVSKTSSFTAYHKGNFGEESQRELAEVFGELTKRGVRALLSNSYTPLIRKLYGGRGHTVEKVHAARMVNSRGDRRGKVAEALVRNF